MSRQLDFETMFNPKSVAIVGTSTGETGSGGTSFINTYRELGFAGRIYPINPQASRILDLPAYPNVGSLPETVDLAIVAVPNMAVPQILVECADAGIKNIQVFTAGFRETGKTKGIELEKQVKKIAIERNLSLVGPNCMGVYVPKSGIGTWPKAPKESGPVAFISQSGGIASEFSRFGAGLGLRFSKVVSIGNAAVLNSTDFLEYLADDPETEIIAMYLEGIGDGRKLTRIIGEINPKKPVIIFNGGLTESGARAAASHTGSLAGWAAAWNAFFRQTGATRVDSFEELLDVTMTFRFLLPLRGRRIAVLSGGGGMSVAGADTCARESLETPVLGETTQSALLEFIPETGYSVSNPLDVGLVLRHPPLLGKTLSLLGADPRIDGFLICLSFGVSQKGVKAAAEQYAEFVGAFGRDNVFRKPLAMVVRSPGYDMAEETEKMRLQAALAKEGVAVYPSVTRAARALSRFAYYHEFLEESA